MSRINLAKPVGCYAKQITSSLKMDEDLDRARETLTELFFEPDILRALLVPT